MKRCTRINKIVGTVVATTVAVLLITACETTVTRFDASVVGPVPILKAELSVPTEYPLVIVRYPAVVDPEQAETSRMQYDLAFATDVDWRSGKAPCKDISKCRSLRSSYRDNTLQSALIKTNYHVHELRARLKRLLPSESVLLQPQRITQRDGRIAFEPINKMPPAAIYVDFFVFVSGHPQKFENDFADTFANRVTPYITIRTTRGARPVTRGAIAGMASFGAKFLGPESGASSDEGEGLTIADVINRALRLVPVDTENGGMFIDQKEPSRRPLFGDRYFSIPSVSYSGDAEAVAEAANNAAADPGQSPFNEVMDYFSYLVVDALNSVNIDAARRPRAMEIIESIDPRLPAAVRAASPPDNLEGRVLTARGCIALEKKFLWTIDEELATAAYRGKFGSLVRLSQVAELTQGTIALGLKDLGAYAFAGGTSAMNTDIRMFEDHMYAARTQEASFRLQPDRGGTPISGATLADIKARCAKGYASQFFENTRFSASAALKPAAPPRPAESPQPQPRVALPAVGVEDAAGPSTPSSVVPSSFPQAPVTEPARSPRGYVVHLASLRSEDDAMKEWERLRRKHAGSLAGLSPSLATVDLGAKGIFVRLRAGTLPDRVAAEALCRFIRDARSYCAVTTP